MKSLCFSCKHAHVIRGRTEREIRVHCNELYAFVREVEWPVAECTAYLGKNEASIEQMIGIAWELRSDPVSKKIIGFAPPERRKDED